ncbi:phosphotransferase [Kitasatospora viridis]|uniref:phosphotransferase n=1 Tax=Kitasatospora viridis TaxID=281105 RepID=UPI001FE99B14|nr:phosphotransferase [Kitasatospora viridis]
MLISDDVPRPRLHGSLDWVADGFGYGADLLDFVPHPVISPHRPDLDHDPGLPDEWWSGLRRALTHLGQAQGVRTTVRDSWFEKAFPQFLGIPAPERVERVTGHGDLHWGNLTAPLVILDWERWGLVPVGYDLGILHVNSLLAPEVAARIRTEFADVLDTPAGRIGELAALAEMLQAVARGYYSELVHLLAVRAAELTGVQPPIPVSSEFLA